MHEAPSEKGNGEADAQHGGKLEASLFIEVTQIKSAATANRMNISVRRNSLLCWIRYHIRDTPIGGTDEDDGIIAIFNKERMRLCLRHFVRDFRRHRV
jgi:hypothetical protein